MLRDKNVKHNIIGNAAPVHMIKKALLQHVKRYSKIVSVV